MHILLYSKAFFPAVGGLETVSLTLAEQITAAGHACTVVTETVLNQAPPKAFPFPVARAPRPRERLTLVRAVDLVHSNGASVALFPYAKLARKPFIWTHQGYQMMSVDGLGWADDGPAPMNPMASLLFHTRRRGLRAGAVEAVKLGLRRAIGRFVDKNVAITRWMAARQPLHNQIIIYNPFPLARFRQVANFAGAQYDFLFVGRLVSEKGVRTLLRALGEMNRRPRRRPATLLVVGDGEQREALEQLAGALGLGANVHFAGEKRGDDLVKAIAQGTVAVVPSEWEEPMGGVALELLAAERPIIVSARGGLAECVGDAGWTFPNGDYQALAAQMASLVDDETLRRSKSDVARRVVASFEERMLVRQYLDLYEEILERRRSLRGRRLDPRRPPI